MEELNVNIIIVNGTELDLNGLQLYDLVERLEEGQNDVVNIPAGESFNLKGYTPAPEYLWRDFKAAVSAKGLPFGVDGQENVVYYQIVAPE